jgi:predicted choloylglycine hydrolase
MAHETEARMRNAMRSSFSFRLPRNLKTLKEQAVVSATEYEIVSVEEYFDLIPNSKRSFHLIKQKDFKFRTADGSSKRIEKWTLRFITRRTLSVHVSAFSKDTID